MQQLVLKIRESHYQLFLKFLDESCLSAMDASHASFQMKQFCSLNSYPFSLVMKFLESRNVSEARPEFVDDDSSSLELIFIDCDLRVVLTIDQIPFWEIIRVCGTIIRFLSLSGLLTGHMT